MIFFLDSNGESLSFLNVGSGEEISIKELAKKISSVVDFREIFYGINPSPMVLQENCLI